MRHSRWLASILLCALATAIAGADDDLDLLTKAKLPTDDAGLLGFFLSRSISDLEYEQLEQQVGALLATPKDQRKAATEKLKAGDPKLLAPIRREIGRLAALDRVDASLLEEVRATIERKATATELFSAAARLVIRRKLAGGPEALFNFIPACPDEFLEDEILGLIAGTKDSAQRFTTALEQKSPILRAAAAYSLARFHASDHRDAVRRLVADPDPRVRRAIVDGFAGRSATRSLAESQATDASTLKVHGIATDEASLLGFFKGRVRSPAELAKIQVWLKELGHVDFRVRERATRELIRQGPIALPMLVAVEQGDDPEAQRRALLCRREIRGGPGSELPIAAARLLASTKQPAEVVDAMLAYVPFADDESVAEEIHNLMTMLVARMPRLPPTLIEALRDGMAARRAAAALVLGRVGSIEQMPAVREAVKDADPSVRTRAVQGLLAAQQVDAVGLLIEQIASCPSSHLNGIEEALTTLAGDSAPTASLTEANGRVKATEAWSAWWKKRRNGVDVGLLRRGPVYQGLVTISEYDGGGAVGQPGRVWQRGRNGETRWVQENLMGPMTAQVLPNGRVVITENAGNRIVERDAQGNVVWEYRVTGGNPIASQRLSNGNTFVATYQSVSEVTPDKTVVHTYNRGPAFYLFSAQRTRDGRIVCMTAQGVIFELDAATGQEIRQIKVGNAGGWCGVHALPGGRYLVSTPNVNGGEIREIDADNKTHWKAGFPGAFRAVRLPNGNVLAVSMSTRKVAEIDREGRIRWEVTCQGRPWSVEYR